LSLMVLIGINVLIINLLGIKIIETNFLVIFGIESLITISLFIYDTRRNKKILNAEILHDKLIKNDLYNYLFLISFICIALYSLIVHQERNGFTEFYFLQEQNSQPVWQRVFSQSDQVVVKLAIKCEELNTTAYSIIAYKQNELFSQQEVFTLHPGSVMTYSIVLPRSKDPIMDYKFILLKNLSATPYRTLNIWIKRK